MTISSASFTERLQRIEHAKVKSGGKMRLHVGDGEWSVKSLTDIKSKVKGARPKARLTFGKLLWAIIFGFGAAIGGTALQLRFLPPPSGIVLDDRFLLTSAGLAFAVAFVMATVFRVRSRIFLLLQMISVIAGLTTLHNLAFWRPDIAEQLFSAEWVAVQQAETVKGSVMYRGTFILF